MDVTDAERALLRRLAEVGGRYTFKPDGQNLLAFRAFEQGIVAVLLSPCGKQLVLIGRDATEVIVLPGQAGRFASITAALTDAGREALV